MKKNDNEIKPQGQYQHHEVTCYQNCLICCGSISGMLKIWCPCICCCCKSPMYQLSTSKIGILQSFGRFQNIIEPGLHIINPITQNIIEIDMKTSILKLTPQQVITKDNVSLKIETVVYYRTVDPIKLVYKLGNNISQIRAFIGQMSFAALRNTVGQHTFQQLLQQRNKISKNLEECVKNNVTLWGLFIENIFIKDLILNPQTQKNLQSAAIQKRLSQAQIISAKADVESAKLLKQTSDILNSSSAMQIRYLQAVQTIITSSNQKTIFVSLKGKQ